MPLYHGQHPGGAVRWLKVPTAWVQFFSGSGTKQRVSSRRAESSSSYGSFIACLTRVKITTSTIQGLSGQQIFAATGITQRYDGFHNFISSGTGGLQKPPGPTVESCCAAPVVLAVLTQAELTAAPATPLAENDAHVMSLDTNHWTQ